MRVLVTGAAGMIGGYTCRELARRGHDVIGADDFSRHPRPDVSEYQLIEADCRDTETVFKLLKGCDHFIAGAALVGGIGYFHTYPLDLLIANERLTVAAVEAAIAPDSGRLRKVTWLSSSMVYESAQRWPHEEGDELACPPPRSSYGFQKLAVEYYARAAWDQYHLPYTILRPFNCTGIGEAQTHAHVLPDLVAKIRGGQDPVQLYGDGLQVRHFTHGADLARGIADSLECPEAVNQDFNLASDEGTTILGLAELVWSKMRPGAPFRWEGGPQFEHDVQRRVPSTGKAFAVLGWEAMVSLEEMVDEAVSGGE